jgi:CheY-like chemotaxis protein
LSTVHGIVRGHGGFTTVHSELGHGSTFSVYLPESGRKPVADVSVARPSGGQKEELTVLVVDDEPTVQRVMCLLLERHHFKTLPASDGAEALRVIQRYGSEIGLIVTDMHMPHMDGLELVKQLSLTPPMPPVVLVSGLLEEHVQEAMQAMGVHAHLDKPFNEASLLEAVRKALAKKPV